MKNESKTPRTDAEMLSPFSDHKSKVYELRDFARELETELAAANERIAKLEAWKESAMQVMNQIDLQAVGKELGLPLGVDIAPEILPGIRAQNATIIKLKGQNAKLREVLEELLHDNYERRIGIVGGETLAMKSAIAALDSTGKEPSCLYDEYGKLRAQCVAKGIIAECCCPKCRTGKEGEG